MVLALHEDHAILSVLARELTHRYAADYRVECVHDPAVARTRLTELSGSGQEVALVLAERSELVTRENGFLDAVRSGHPHAKCALLVPWDAWVDTASAEAIRASVALGRAHYYVLLPAGPLDEVFHEAVSSFLLEWATERRIVPQTIHIVGEEWSGRASELRDTFERCAAPHTFCLANSDQGRVLMDKAGPDARLPLMILPDGRVLSDPSNDEIAEAAGVTSDFDEAMYDVVIIGAGPAGLSAAVYGASEGLRVLVLDEGGVGGQARSSSLIRNYLGFPKGVSGSRLAEQAYEQASVFGATFVFMHRVASLDRSGDVLRTALADGRSVSSRALILATGASYRRLGIPELEALSGAGVFYGGPASVAPALSGKDAYVAGGGNSAGQAVLHLARYARRVTLVVRAASLDAGMSHYLVQEIHATSNIDVRTCTEVVGGGGESHLQQLALCDSRVGRREDVAADALFVLIGATPRTEWLPAELMRDPQGFLLTGETLVEQSLWRLERRPYALETSMPGVFAAGDVRSASIKRVASAVGEGSVAIRLVQELLAHEQLDYAAKR